MTSGLITRVVSLSLLCLGVLGAGAAGQQHNGNYPGAYSLTNRPTVSPYVNLLNQGSNLDGTLRSYAVYQTFVRPQLEQRGVEATSELEVRRPQPAPHMPSSKAKAPFQMGTNRTGHGAAFLSYSHFYTYPQQRPNQ